MPGKVNIKAQAEGRCVILYTPRSEGSGWSQGTLEPFDSLL